MKDERSEVRGRQDALVLRSWVSEKTLRPKTQDQSSASRRMFPNRFPSFPMRSQMFPNAPKRFPNDSQIVPNCFLNAVAIKRTPFSREFSRSHPRFVLSRKRWPRKSAKNARGDAKARASAFAIFALFRGRTVRVPSACVLFAVPSGLASFAHFVAFCARHSRVPLLLNRFYKLLCISMYFLCSFYVLSMQFLCTFYAVSMYFLCSFYVLSMQFLYSFDRHFPLNTRRFPDGFRDRPPKKNFFCANRMCRPRKIAKNARGDAMARASALCDLCALSWPRRQCSVRVPSVAAPDFRVIWVLVHKLAARGVPDRTLFKP